LETERIAFCSRLSLKTPRQLSDAQQVPRQDISGKDMTERKTEMLSGGEMLIRALHDEGVEYVFGYPRWCSSCTFTMRIFPARTNVQHILVRHEQAASARGDGLRPHHRQSGRGCW
jgi:hypothetical protein